MKCPLAKDNEDNVYDNDIVDREYCQSFVFGEGCRRMKLCWQTEKVNCGDEEN